jgi:hypothetical protein
MNYFRIAVIQEFLRSIHTSRLVGTNPAKFLEARFFWPNFRVKSTIRELGRFVNTAVSREHNRANAMARILSLVLLLR